MPFREIDTYTDPRLLRRLRETTESVNQSSDIGPPCQIDRLPRRFVEEVWNSPASIGVEAHRNLASETRRLVLDSARFSQWFTLQYRLAFLPALNRYAQLNNGFPEGSLEYILETRAFNPEFIVSDHNFAAQRLNRNGFPDKRISRLNVLLSYNQPPPMRCAWINEEYAGITPGAWRGIHRDIWYHVKDLIHQPSEQRPFDLQRIGVKKEHTPDFYYMFEASKRLPYGQAYLGEGLQSNI